MLKELEKTSTMLSLEAHCGTASLENAFSKLPEYLGQMRTFLSNKIGSPLTLNFLGNRPQDFIRTVAKTNYMDFKHVTAFVPQGLNVSYAAHQKVLKDAVAHCLTIEADVIDPLIRWLGERIGNPTSLSSVSSSIKKDSGKMAEIEKAYHACFSNEGQRQSEVPYMNAVKRQSEWSDIVSGVEDLERQLTPELHARLLEKMARLDDLLATLIRRMADTPNSYQFSAQALSDLANASYSAARAFEFYGLTKHRVEVYTTAVRDTVKKLQVFVR